MPRVDLALAHVDPDGEIAMSLISGPLQEHYSVPRSVAATLVGELARALATVPARQLSSTSEETASPGR